MRNFTIHDDRTCNLIGPQNPTSHVHIAPISIKIGQFPFHLPVITSRLWFHLIFCAFNKRHRSYHQPYKSMSLQSQCSCFRCSCYLFDRLASGVSTTRPFDEVLPCHPMLDPQLVSQITGEIAMLTANNYIFSD